MQVYAYKGMCYLFRGPGPFSFSLSVCLSLIKCNILPASVFTNPSIFHLNVIAAGFAGSWNCQGFDVELTWTEWTVPGRAASSVVRAFNQLIPRPALHKIQVASHTLMSVHLLSFGLDFCYGDKSELVVVDGTITKQEYKRVLQQSLFPSATFQNNFVLVQDKYVPHAARAIAHFLENQDVKVMD